MAARVPRLLGLIIFVSLLLALVLAGLASTASQSRSASSSASDYDGPPLFASFQYDQPTINDDGQEKNETYWDDADSHKWIGESWGDNIQVDWVEFDSRKTLRARVTSTDEISARIRTDAFPAENWETKTGLRADIYQGGEASGVDVKLEVRGRVFDPPIDIVNCNNLQPITWTTCTWNFNTIGNDYSTVAHLSLVFDHLNGTGPTFYVDNLRLVSATDEEEWDDMDDGSRQWFYFGNWFNWNSGKSGLEPITHNGNNPTTPPGSIYLQWDYENGPYHPLTTAEVGTSHLNDLSDWSRYNRIVADVKVKAGTDDWQTIIWDLPWPPWFDNTDVDEIKFVVNKIDEHLTGTLFLDNISPALDIMPSPVTGLVYVFEDFDDRNPTFNDFNGLSITHMSAYP